VRGDLTAEVSQNLLQHGVGFAQYLIVPEPQHRKTHLLQIRAARCASRATSSACCPPSSSMISHFSAQAKSAK